MVYIKFILYICIIYTFNACYKKNISIENYTTINNTKLNIPEVCKNYYKKDKYKIAVVDFKNNTNFKDLSSVNLSEAFISKLEKILLNTNNAKLYSRKDFDKINDELKLQDSGILEQSSLIKLNQLSGVRYLVTGSIDYIQDEYNNYSKYTAPIAHLSLFTNNKDLQLSSIALHLGSTLFNGTNIKTAITVKILDIKTSKIIFSKQIKKEVKINSSSKSSNELIANTIVHSINDTLPLLEEYFNKIFTQYTYINEIKSNKYKEIIVQLNIGSNNKIKQGDKFVLIKLKEHIDLLTNEKSCNAYETKTKLEITNIIYDNYSYARVINYNNNHNIELLNLVKKIQE